MALASNIGPGGRRRRYVLGTLALAVGIGLAIALVVSGAPLGARWLVFLPFGLGALGVLQAYAGT